MLRVLFLYATGYFDSFQKGIIPFNIDIMFP